MSRLNIGFIVALAPLLFVLSCGRQGASVPEPLAAAELAPVLQKSFESADAPTREAALKVVEEAQQHSVSAAFLDVKQLADQPNLTAEQRMTAIRAADTIGRQLLEAAQNGDAQAAETLHKYRASH
jgi:hypothetical protein